ncbi:uncharacterized protein LOC116338412 isoform X1 [Contarinia nasturtii]|uniref:uncharacterized protein LOC116338412 isoform X1 n=1 Tax=Contarinia nasturtii TaxID=265458 RepID=UPI0012D41104|nr:uncharacterized protein LOC116338412 isoform X1 [Contarinia nasturtii]
MSIFHRLFVAYLVATPYILFTNGDAIPVESDANTNRRQSLDEISKEVNEMKAELTKSTNEQQPDTVSDGGNSQRAAIGEIENIKKIVEILEKIVGDVVPTIVDRQNAQEQAQRNRGASDSSSDPIKILPKGLKLLQHHALAANVDENNAATNHKPNLQSDDN